MPLGALLQLPQFRSFSAEDVQRVVDTNGKQRFALQPGDPGTGPLIRANQGHSLQVGLTGQVGESQVGPLPVRGSHCCPSPRPCQVPELELMPLETPRDLPPMLVHGTFWQHWPSILLKGLSCRGRTHIHLATGLPGDPGVISGQYPRPQLLPPTVLPGPSRGPKPPIPCMQQYPLFLTESRTPACKYLITATPDAPGPSSSCPYRHAAKLPSGRVHQWAPGPGR